MKKERRDFRLKTAIQLALVIALFLISTTGYDLLKGKTLTGQIPFPERSEEKMEEPVELEWRIADANEQGIYDIENVMTVEKLYVEDNTIYYSLKGIDAGEAFFLFREKGAEVWRTAGFFKVSKSGRVRDVYMGDFPNWRFHLLMNILCLTLFAVLCLANLLRFYKKIPYSYEIMFTGGLLIWLTSTIIIQWYAYLNSFNAYDYYVSLQNSAYDFMVYTAPIVWIFCIAMSISNVSLIRHEGFRPVNALGIIISVLLFVGSFAGFIIQNLLTGSPAWDLHWVRILMSSFCSIYSFFACLLEGAILGGILAAKRIPSMDCDYIIILGCMIRKDGSLTPLLRGRVDRAIEHAKAQEKISGKKAIFVPSGGQGRDEVMSEGDAMKNYLLSQGIPEEQILVEDKAVNTSQNMSFSKQLIDARKADARIAFSTTNYHVFRSGIIATQKDFCPEGMGSKTKWYFWPNAFMREFLGMVVYTKYTIGAMLLVLIGIFAMIDMMIIR